MLHKKISDDRADGGAHRRSFYLLEERIPVEEVCCVKTYLEEFSDLGGRELGAVY